MKRLPRRRRDTGAKASTLMLWWVALPTGLVGVIWAAIKVLGR